MGADGQYLFVNRPGGSEKVDLDPGSPCTIGRAQDNRIVLSDASVSRYHACVRFQDGEWVVEDLGAKNGTRVRNQRIERPTALRPGDEIKLGSFGMVFSASGTSPSARIGDVAAPLNMRTVPAEAFTTGAALDTKTITGGMAPERVDKFLHEIDRVGKELLRHRPLEDLYRFIVELTNDVLRADRTALLTRGATDEELVTKAVTATGRGSGDEIVLSRSIAQLTIDKKQAILTSDAQQDTRFKAQESVIQQRIHSAMAAPLWHDNEVLGLLYVDNVAAPVPFEEIDLRLLTLIAHLAAVKIRESEALEEVARQQLLEAELKRAATLQQMLLPTEPLVRGTMIVAGRNVPSFDVGGDYFDYMARDNGQIVLGLGDVAGKGMSAALLMTHLHASVRAQMDEDRPLDDVMGRLNRSIYQNVRGERFITLVMARVDDTTGEVVYVNGGHNPPFVLRRSGAIETLNEGGLLLGVIPEAQYAQGRFTMEPGDLVIFYSDGITEAMDDVNEEYGEERLAAFLRAHQSDAPLDLVEALIQDVCRFSSKGKPADDVTVVVLRRS